MINKYWPTNKKKKWLDHNYIFISDGNWGGYWEDTDHETVATIDDYNYDQNLIIHWEKIKLSKMKGVKANGKIN